MRIITAPEYHVIRKEETSIFLAGGITDCKDWQKETINELLRYDDILKNLVVMNPRRENFVVSKGSTIDEESQKQIKWEFDYLERCDIFSMYFCKSTSDQPICMYELGRNILRIQERFEDWAKRIIITVEDGYSRKKDVIIQTELATDLTNLVEIGDVNSHVFKIKRAYNLVKKE